VTTALIGHNLFHIGVPVLEKAIRTAAVYGGILLLLRLGGKRDLAQLNSFDLVVLLLLSNVVQNAIIGNDNSMAGGLLGAGILVAINALVVRVVGRNERAVRWFEGVDTVLVRDGKLDHAALTRLGLRDGDVRNAIRRQGADNVQEVKLATLMPGGSIVVDLFPEEQGATKRDVQSIEAKLDELLAAVRR
jgi:uncharacterized membrane protein YcaP (DUF421 family)